MTDELTDADLDLMRRWASMSDPRRNGTMDWEAAIAELQDLRARRAQDTPSDPAATEPAAWAVYGSSTGALRYLTEDDAKADEYARGGYRVVPLGPLRAPGAEAAAPTEDEVTAHVRRPAWVESTDWRAQAERLWGLLSRDRVALARVKAQRDAHHDESQMWQRVVENDTRLLARARRGVPPAPSAGEDEAAVERVARALFDHADNGHDRRWDDTGGLAALARDAYRDRARAALAAARGPRTQDGA